MIGLNLSAHDIEQQFRRAVFNVIARNQDDHVKNIAFLMDRQGQWQLSPAFDVAYFYNPSGAWTSRHQMSINGKRDEFELDDLVTLARTGGIKKRKAATIVSEVRQSVSNWQQHADLAEVSPEISAKIEKSFRLDIAE